MALMQAICPLPPRLVRPRREAATLGAGMGVGCVPEGKWKDYAAFLFASVSLMPDYKSIMLFSLVLFSEAC